MNPEGRGNGYYMTTVIVIVAAVGVALLADAIAVALRRRALARTEARSDAPEAQSIAKVIQLEDVRRATEPDERAARGPSARPLPAPEPELDPDAAG